MTELFGLSGGAAPPLILAIETSGSACSAALAQGDEVLGFDKQTMRHGHGEALLPMVASLAPGINPTEIDLVAASVGPGGFTGIRVGLAAAHGIALAAGARAIGVTSFAAVAARLIGRDDRRPVLVAIDSRRSDLYVQLIRPPGETIAPTAIAPDELATYIAGLIGSGPLLVAGDAAEKAAAALAAHGGVEVAADSAADALGVLAAARPVWRDNAAGEPLVPLYLRAPDISFPKNRLLPVARPR